MRKHFHTAEAIFRRSGLRSSEMQQWPRELQPQQIVAVGGRAAEGLGAQGARSSRQQGQRGHRGAGNFQPQSARLRAESAGSRPTFRPHLRSGRWQIPEIPCLSRRGCEQKRGSQAAIWSTSAAHFPLSHRSCRPLRRLRPALRSTLRGQISGRSPAKPGEKTALGPSRTAKQAKAAGVSGSCCSLYVRFQDLAASAA